MDEFKYTPLVLPKSTRLIQMLPSEASSDIRCKIFENDLETPPKSGYIALSYCWGSMSKTASITLNSYPFCITENLQAALQVLQKLYPKDLFWIDAICIDQMNLRERNIQVLNMRKIYEQAKMVVVWLGKDTVETTVAIDWIERVWCFWKSLGSTDTIGKTTLLNACVQRVHELFDSPEGVIDFLPVHGLAQLLLRPWFERVWIVQEATTTRENIVVICGDAVTHWNALVATTEIVTHLMWRPELRGFFVNVPFLDNQSSRRLFNVDKQRQYEKPVFDFLHVLAKFRHFQATDPKDKVYALRGLAADLLEDEVLPDYSLTPQSVFIQVARHCIISKMSFELLGFCDYSTRDLALPSWVPSWSIQSTRHPLAKRRVHGKPALEPPVYAAATLPMTSFKERQRNCSISSELVLRVAGFRVDTVESTAQFEIPDSYEFEDFSCKTRWSSDRPAIYGLHISESEVYRDSSESLITAYSRAIVADVAKLGSLRDRGYNITLDYWSQIRNYTQPPADGLYRKEWGSLLFSTTGRALFWSKDGYLGLGPIDAQPGDLVCIFFGADVLYILRPIEEGFHLIGECYVHGLMDGEAYSLLDMGLHSVESFAIR